jgi:cell wall-associated NlpC family hydrolase
MKCLALALLLAAGPANASPNPVQPGVWERVQTVIQRHLGRPYVWGAAGMKSFDCSGFVWRILQDNGYFLKRTTARKLYISLPRVPHEERWRSGNIVFFSNLKHCGIVAGPQTFYHAQTSVGTNLSRFDPYWRPKICGVRMGIR